MLPNFPSCGHLAAGFSWLKLWKHSFSSFHGKAYALFSCYGPRAVFARRLPWLSHAVVLPLDSGYLVTWFLASHLYRPLSPLPRPWPCTQVEGTYLLCCNRYFFSTACPERPPILIIAIDNRTLIRPYSTLPYPPLPYHTLSYHIQSYSSLWFDLWTEACTQGFVHAKQTLLTLSSISSPLCSLDPETGFHQVAQDDLELTLQPR